MNNPESTPETKNGIEVFRDEMREFQRKESSGELTSGHLENFDAHELTEEDFAMWQKFKDHTLTLEEFNHYRDGVSREDASRRSFVGLLGNKFAAQRQREELEAWKKAKGKK